MTEIDIVAPLDGLDQLHLDMAYSSNLVIRWPIYLFFDRFIIRQCFSEDAKALFEMTAE